MKHSVIDTIGEGLDTFDERSSFVLLGVFGAIFGIIGLLQEILPLELFFTFYIMLVPVVLALPIVGIRTFTSGETERIPESAYKDDIWVRITKLLVCYVLLGLAIVPVGLLWFVSGFLVFLGPLGVLLLVLLGFASVALFVYVWLGLIFVIYVISAEDRSLVDSLKQSWRLAKGNRVYLFVLSFLVTVGSGVLNGVLGGLLTLLPGIGVVLAYILNGCVAVVSLAILTSAYTSLGETVEEEE